MRTLVVVLSVPESNLRLHVSHVAWRRLPLPRFSRQTTLLLMVQKERADALSKHLLSILSNCSNTSMLARVIKSPTLRILPYS
jgi:hypothetical protein